jgi:hypothetical protein
MSSHQNCGFFRGDIETVWRRDSNLMILAKDFSFVSPEMLNGEKGEFVWTAPKGSETDGASIPRIFWTFGHPFEPPYRAAAVLHDYECRIKEKPWTSVHKMFYLACICAGAIEVQAKLMYWGVYNFGPRWGGYRLNDSSGMWSGYKNSSLPIPTPPETDMESVNFSIQKPPTTEEIKLIKEILEVQSIPVDEVPLLKP